MLKEQLLNVVGKKRLQKRRNAVEATLIKLIGAEHYNLYRKNLDKIQDIEDIREDISNLLEAKPETILADITEANVRELDKLARFIRVERIHSSLTVQELDGQLAEELEKMKQANHRMTNTPKIHKGLEEYDALTEQIDNYVF
jgi:DNA primase catalytic subunit